MIYQAPRHLPSFTRLADDLTTRNAQQISDYLGVTPRTYSRWLAADDAPRSASMSLFWVSRWGVSLIDAHAYNTANMLQGQVSGLQAENTMLRTRIARLERLGDFGSANQPMERMHY